MKSQRVCIFPIPNTSVLPYQTIQLHVFEPRYRAMVRHCVETGDLMAVAYAKRPLGDKPVMTSSAEQILSSNQQSYDPAEVFCGGSVKILKEFDDGRFLVESTAQSRFRLKTIVQQVPFLVAECDLFLPGPLGVMRWSEIIMKMKELLGEHFTALDRDLLSLPEPNDFKFFHLLSRFQWPAKEVQSFLDLPTTEEMADRLLKTLHGVQLITSPEGQSTQLH